MSNTEAIPRDEFFENLLGDFLDESGQLLNRLNENMLQLDEWFRSLEGEESCRCDVNLLNEMFRSAHSIKGLSAMLGLNDINHLTHKIENVFDAARKDELPLNCDVVELMFQSIDCLVGLVDALKEPNHEPVDCTKVLDDIHSVLASAGVEKQQTSQADAEKALNQSLAETSEQAPAPTPEAAAQIPAAESASETLPEPPGDSPEQYSCEPAVETAPPNEATAVQSPSSANSVATASVIDHFAGIVDECDPHSKYISIFIDETELSLDNLTDLLLALEQEGHRAAIEELLMTSHRIKGSAASVGLNHAAKLAHLMEDLMQDFSLSGRSLTPKITDALLACIDGLRTYVNGLKTGNPRTGTFDRLAQDLIASQHADAAPAADRSAQMQENRKSQTAKPAATPAATAAPAEPSVAGIDESLKSRVLERLKDTAQDAALAGVVTFQPKLALVGLKGRLIYEKLLNMGEICWFSPAIDLLEEMNELDCVEFGVVTEKSQESVKQLLRVAGVVKIDLMSITRQPQAANVEAAPVQAAKSASAESKEPKNVPVEEVAAPASADPSAAKADKAAPADNTVKPTETLRVDIERLDQLMNLAGQLVINKARFVQIGDRLKKAVSGRHSRNALNDIYSVLAKLAETGDNENQPSMETVRSHARHIQNNLEEIRRDVETLTTVRTSVNDLFETIHLLDRVTDGIQQSVMDTRMLPIGPLFQRFKRVVRDISRANGKNMRLELNGEKTELDKRMIDELGDPLIHMVRNSADHGIESPEVRLAAGKPEQGTVTLDAFHRGNSIYICVSDDGKGLDSEKIKAKALEKGLITPVEAERMTKAQIFQLIWEPGLSTAEKVTEVSGRGMGMDIVKSKIDLLNGTIELDSEPGRGTTVTIKLPLTLAILPSLMVSIDGDIFAMPLESVVEIVSLSPANICTVHQQPTALVRGRVVSMVDLGSVFAWHGGKKGGLADGNAAENGIATLVIINENGRELGLAVDRVIGEEDIVIKSMAENYRNVQGVAGASILGDGTISLILDLAALIDMATCRKAEV